MSIVPRPAWRVFPWDPDAPEGEPFSPSHLPPFQGHGRFDLRDSPQGILYLAETPEHAIGEKLQDLRNQPLADEDLFELGHRYALSSVQLPESVFAEIVDLCDPPTVAELDTPPDQVAALSRETTQAISRRLYDAGYAGFRWWSTFFGEWHGLVIFRDRLAGLAA
ncbi:MAG: RES family NAD+ phosphorylase, partial [Gemmatimonadetes bacterium]|nr:RES family NAD+ phosphorylase [Gemmatimonadota bacterium]